MIAAIYPIYLYFNFSGYMDVVIGVARFFGIVLAGELRPAVLVGKLHQFLEPLAHHFIQLVENLRLQPADDGLHGAHNRTRALPLIIAVVAFFVTFFLVGLWHGQTSEFLFFGFLQGGGVSCQQALSGR